MRVRKLPTLGTPTVVPHAGSTRLLRFNLDKMPRTFITVLSQTNNDTWYSKSIGFVTECLEKNRQVVRIDLQHARIETAMSRASITAGLGVKECEPELTRIIQSELCL